MQPTTYMPTDYQATFHYIVVLLDLGAAVVSTVLVFSCNVGKAQYYGTIPERLPLPPNMTSLTQYMDASPWVDDANFATESWNPFALILLFEWLTLAFAVCYLVDHWQSMQYLCYFSEILGIVSYVIWWGITKESYIAMHITAVFSFLLCAVICYAYATFRKDIPGFSVASRIQTRAAVMNNRVWQMPKKLSDWRQKPAGFAMDPVSYQDKLLTGDQKDYDKILGIERRVIFRYAEYCVTAPLLFLSIMCLLVQNAPAWLFLNGYWLIVACNMWGMLVHTQYAYVRANPSRTPRDWTTWFGEILCVPKYKDRGWIEYSYLNCAWICLLVPIAGLIYVIRDYLLWGGLPWVVNAMIINLLFSYSLFGILPTITYTTGWEWDNLAYILDILNVISKLFIPLFVMIGLYTSPVGFMPCST